MPTQERGSFGSAPSGAPDAGPPADKPSKRRRKREPAGAPLTVRDVGMRLKALAEAARRHRIAVDRAPTEDELVPSEDGKRNTWRQAWLAHHSRLRLRAEALDKERKALVSALEFAQHAEQLRETEDKERVARALLALREGRTDVARRELGEEGVVH